MAWHKGNASRESGETRQPAFPGKVAFHGVEMWPTLSAMKRDRQPSPEHELAQKSLPIADLIYERMTALGLDRERLDYRLGYTNPIKAAERVQALCDGFIDNRKSLRALHRLPAALEIQPEEVGTVAATRAVFAERRRLRQEKIRRAEAEEEAEYRASFEPHGFLWTRETWPSSITMFGLSGGEGWWLIIPIDATRPPVTYAAQAWEGLPAIAGQGEDGNLYATFFGRVLGYYVNYTPDRAIRYDLDGTQLRSYRLGRATVRLGN